MQAERLQLIEEGNMKRTDITIRDPFILLQDDTYYLYGTRSETTWTNNAEGFDCYKSRDLENWEGPIEIFHKPEGFWADRCFWAPECIAYQGAYYLITTLASAERRKGIYVLRAERPEGPFVPYSDLLTPPDWTCIDATTYMEGDAIYMVYSHSFEDSKTGDMCYQKLSADLKHAITEPVVMFQAAEASWAHPVPFAKQEFGIDGDVYFTDGPYLFKYHGQLYMTWSSWGTNGYAVGTAYAKDNTVEGKWTQLEKPFFPENGGHGMAFFDKEGILRYTLHYPNDKYNEHPMFMELVL